MAKVGFKKDPWLTECKFEKGIVEKNASAEKGCFIYRCKDRKCNWQQSVFKGSFFSNGKKNPNEVLLAILLWLGGANMPTLKQLTGWSEKTVLEYCHNFRKLVAANIKDFLQWDLGEDIITYDKVQIGGPGIEVQIDESAFGKRKYNIGHKVDTKWVFGGVEIIPDETGRRKGGEFFAVVVPDRTKVTLEEQIRRFIRPGSIIISDKWKAYNGIDDIPHMGYVHYDVNHSENYVDPESGACTNDPCK